MCEETEFQRAEREALIRVTRIAPPVPGTAHDWQAVIDPEHGPAGYGATREEALADLGAALADRAYDADKADPQARIDAMTREEMRRVPRFLWDFLGG